MSNTYNTLELASQVEKYKEILLSNLIMVAEIPAPMNKSTELKATYIAERLSDYDSLDISLDEMGNVIAIIPGKDTQKNIALVAHMDTIHPESVDRTVRVETETAIGAGLVDDNLGVAALVTLPHILQDMDIELESNVILCFSANSLGSGDLKGTRFFLDHVSQNINYGICVEGYPIGRISYQSLGIMRQEINIAIPEEYDWTRFGNANAILDLNNLMNSILEIPIPSRPQTTIVFNSVQGGRTSSNLVPDSSLSLEIRSESNEIVDQLGTTITGLAQELSSKSGAQINIKVISRRNLGGIDFIHPLVQSLVKILDELDIQHRMTPSASDLSAFIDTGIPAITLGLTQCDHVNSEKETMYIEPIYKGLAQLLALLLDVDKGFKND